MGGGSENILKKGYLFIHNVWLLSWNCCDNPQLATTAFPELCIELQGKVLDHKKDTKRTRTGPAATHGKDFVHLGAGVALN